MYTEDEMNAIMERVRAEERGTLKSSSALEEGSTPSGALHGRHNIVLPRSRPHGESTPGDLRSASSSGAGARPALGAPDVYGHWDGRPRQRSPSDLRDAHSSTDGARPAHDGPGAYGHARGWHGQWSPSGYFPNSTTNAEANSVLGGSGGASTSGVHPSSARSPGGFKPPGFDDPYPPRVPRQPHPGFPHQGFEQGPWPHAGMLPQQGHHHSFHPGYGGGTVTGHQGWATLAVASPHLPVPRGAGAIPPTHVDVSVSGNGSASGSAGPGSSHGGEGEASSDLFADNYVVTAVDIVCFALIYADSPGTCQMMHTHMSRVFIPETRLVLEQACHCTRTILIVLCWACGFELTVLQILKLGFRFIRSSNKKMHGM